MSNNVLHIYILKSYTCLFVVINFIAGMLSLQISIEPNEAGTFTAQLQVYSFPVVGEVQPVTHSLGPVLALEVVAEEPKVEVCKVF